jgi:hypothetical protein
MYQIKRLLLDPNQNLKDNLKEIFQSATPLLLYFGRKERRRKGRRMRRARIVQPHPFECSSNRGGANLSVSHNSTSRWCSEGHVIVFLCVISTSLVFPHVYIPAEIPLCIELNYSTASRVFWSSRTSRCISCQARSQASAAVQLNSSVFWVIRRREVV